MKILTGNSNKPLAEAISAKLALPLVKANIRRFSDNEIFVEILENVRGEDVFVIQSTSFPANDHLMELLITIDALRRSLQRKRADHIVGFDARHAQDRETKCGNQLQQRLDLHPQVVWHRRPIGLVLWIDFIAECLSGGIHHEGGVLRPLLQVSAQHVDHAKHRACREAIGRSQLASLRLDGVIGAIEVVVTVNQYESGHGRILPPCSPALSVAGA